MTYAILLGGSEQTAQAQLDPSQTEEGLREEAAYTVGVQAYVYGYPLVEMYKTRFIQIDSRKNSQRTRLNQFHHSRHLIDDTFKAVVSPNNDTLYSSAWLDLSEGPVILSVPAVKDRYYTFQFMDFFTNNFAHVGTRTTGNGEGVFAVVGPRWKGELPGGVRRIESPTNAVWLLGRTLVAGSEDINNVRAVQDQYRLTPLGAWGKGAAPPRQFPTPSRPAYDPTEPLKFFEFMNEALRENPPPEREAALMSVFGRIGVGPGKRFSTGELDHAIAKGLKRAIEFGRRLVEKGPDTAGLVRNGWHFPPKQIGAFGDDYLLRATTAMKLLAALSPEEAIYPTVCIDDHGHALSGRHRYVLRFEKGETPPVEVFWSLSLYKLPERHFAANPLKRFSLGDRTKDLTYGEDGSLEIFLQRESPGKDREGNWLPAPEGEFCLILRAYLPGNAIRDGTWKPPSVVRVK